MAAAYHTSLTVVHLSAHVCSRKWALPVSSFHPASLSSRRAPLAGVSVEALIFASSVPLIRRNPVFAAFASSSSTGEGDAAAEEDADASFEEDAMEESEALAEDPEGADLVGVGKQVIKKPPRKRRIKLGEIMGILNKRAIEASEKARPVPDLRSGDIVEIKLEVPDNRRRLAIYRGIVISKQNAGIHTTIRIRRIIAGVGVEIVFPIYSPSVKEIKVVSHRKVRRARLYYLREKLPRFCMFK
ncbi:hypothetical protein HPP92_014471 [Vanilla planifolia]|uniref:50S ribosomal protein L19, chloroplastic n=1 Tax=Vanilla planifolia TaxID=51239 RepID=A0A835QGV1_VANPL|nr:hypothetical protein HPP92_014888 [Vanilla planifolia]KAG0474785.1 hypothetical protein HPP92_014471 [Vanilla planifolia]